MIFDFIVLVIILFLIAVLINQVVIPLFKGQKVFPAFHTTPLQEELQEERRHVDSLREQNVNLKELGDLLKARKELEKQIASIDVEIKKEQE